MVQERERLRVVGNAAPRAPPPREGLDLSVEKFLPRDKQDKCSVANWDFMEGRICFLFYCKY
jgi:hypothetical protein